MTTLPLSLGVVFLLGLSYLGIPFGGKLSSPSFWDPDKITKRVDGWKGVYFSFGGRITLIQSSLSSIPLYFLSFSGSQDGR